MTARELASELGIDVNFARSKLDVLKKQGRAHICSYRRDEDGGRLYPRALWKAGPRRGHPPEKPAPLTDSDYCRRYRARQVRRVTSVWALGQTPRERRLGEALR